VNTDKSKVMGFSRGKLPRNLNFSLNGGKLEIVNSHPSWISISLEIVCNPLKLQFVKYDSRSFMNTAKRKGSIFFQIVIII
jgi:P pilus assembly chaperone PapD